MGMYTEIFVNVDFKMHTPKEVIDTVSAMCRFDYDSCHLVDKPNRWGHLFGNGSYYTPYTSVGSLTFDDISKNYSLIGKGDIKNYNNEIEDFFDFIRPWCDNDFIGYHRYEEDMEPTLVFSN